MLTLHSGFIRQADRMSSGAEHAAPRLPDAEEHRDVLNACSGQPRVALQWRVGADGRLIAGWRVATQAVGAAAARDTAA